MWFAISVFGCFVGAVLWATSTSRPEDSSGPIVHLDQECPYKIEK